MKGLRAAWPEQIAGVRAEDFVFIDESGVNRAMTRLHARRRINPRASGPAPRHRGDNVSILGALCLRGPLQPMCVNGATDGRVFLTFLKDVLVPQLWPGAVVVLDNLGAHKVKGVREQIEAAGARLLYLPPYSGGLQPHRTALEQTQEPPAPGGRAHQRGAGPCHCPGLGCHHRAGCPRLLCPPRLPRQTQMRSALVPFSLGSAWPLAFFLCHPEQV